jgi:hypothetical protein
MVKKKALMLVYIIKNLSSVSFFGTVWAYDIDIDIDYVFESCFPFTLPHYQ